MLTLSLFILMLLILATLVVRYQYNVSNSSDIVVNQKRIQTWWLIYCICIPPIYLGGWVLTLFIYGVIYWAAYEIVRLQNFRITKIRIVLFTLVMVLYTLSLNYFDNNPYLFLLLPVVILLTNLFYTNSTVLRTLYLLLFCISSLHSLLLITQVSSKFNYDNGLILLFLMFITSVNDIVQYMTGRLIGRNQLAAQLSPNKTIEGAMGGIIFTGILFSIILPKIIDVSVTTALIIGVFVATLGILGDLHFSFYKRLAGVKQSGDSLPGHGGILDRIDSLTLTAPGFAMCLSLLS